MNYITKQIDWNLPVSFIAIGNAADIWMLMSLIHCGLEAKKNRTFDLLRTKNRKMESTQPRMCRQNGFHKSVRCACCMLGILWYFFVVIFSLHFNWL